MSEKQKDITITILFIVTIIGVFLANLLIKDNDISISERRKLAKFPKITLDSIFKEPLGNSIEEYAMDQFILRDEFRSIKTFVKLNILNQKDNNELFEINNNIYKMLYPLNENSVVNVANKINNIYNTYLNDSFNVYYSIVPDKNYYIDDNSLYLKLDYDKLEDIMSSNINSNIKYIDLFDTLSETDYYMTDTHWKQENIVKVVEKIATQMGFLDRLSLEYEKKRI